MAQRLCFKMQFSFSLFSKNVVSDEFITGPSDRGDSSMDYGDKGQIGEAYRWFARRRVAFACLYTPPMSLH